MTAATLEAFDLLAHAELFEERLAAAASALAERPDRTEEKTWLDAARRQVARAREGIQNLPTRALRLPELEPLRAEGGRALQGAAVSEAERLHAAIVAAGGDRSPLLEVIYRSLKLPTMRRCGRAEFEKFGAEIEKRLESSYVERMLADASYASCGPAVAKLRAALAEWRDVFASPPLTEPEARALRDALEGAAARLDLPCRQARLLAEAALLSTKELLESSGILDKPRRRAARTARTPAES